MVRRGRGGGGQEGYGVVGVRGGGLVGVLEWDLGGWWRSRGGGTQGQVGVGV